MKILSVAIPCYNSAAYMEKCIDSILKAGEDVEILIVNDGSQKDNTAEIADQYAEKYPDIIKAIHQENGGHGEAVNAGLRNATGLYYKVVDSDDWVNTKALVKLIEKMKELEAEGGVDMFLANFVYDKVGVKRKKLMRFHRVFPENEVFGWDAMGHMNVTQYILMHNIFYRTDVLRTSGLVLPKHTFYVDNLFAFVPFPYVKKLYYMDINLYHYFIGRDDQSVNETVMIGRIDQQLRVNKLMMEEMAKVDFSDKSKRLKRYMELDLKNITTVSSILLIIADTEEAFEKKREVWNYLKETDLKMYRKIRWSLFGILLHLPGKGGRALCKGVYKIANKLIGFN